jgi:translation elongation factor EF-1beta
MGKTIALFRIKPAEGAATEGCIEEMKTVKRGQFADAKENPIGFGVVVIKAAFMIAEKDDEAVEELTKELNDLKSIEEAELEGLTLA